MVARGCRLASLRIECLDSRKRGGSGPIISVEMTAVNISSCLMYVLPLSSLPSDMLHIRERLYQMLVRVVIDTVRVAADVGRRVICRSEDEPLPERKGNVALPIGWLGIICAHLYIPCFGQW